MQHEELILKHFNKTLTNEEEVLFSNLLKRDANFKILFDEHKNMQLAFGINEKENLKTLLNNFDTKEESSKNNKLNSKTIALLTACCLVIGLFYFTNYKNSPSYIYDDYFEIYPNVLEPIVRGETTKNSEAFSAYENENYKEAENNFKFILESKTDYNIEFYYAMALLNQNKIKSSDSVLSILKNKTHDFIPEVYWYSALIAVKCEDFKRASIDLKKLQKLNSNFKKEDIKKLLENVY